MTTNRLTTAKEYLNQYRAAKELLRQCDTRLLDINAELTGLDVGTIRSPWPDGQPHGTGTTDPTGTEAAADADRMNEARRKELRRILEGLKVQTERQRAELWKKREEIEATIQEVGDTTLMAVLHRRYIQGQTFELIAVEMSYSWRHTIRLHGEALAAVDKILRRKK